MINFRHLIVIILIALTFTACGLGGNSTGNSTNNDNGISFSLGDEQWYAQGYGDLAEFDGKKIMSLLGTNMDNGMDQFGIKIHDFNGIGGYKALNSGVGFVLTFSRMNKETKQTKFYQITEEEAQVTVTAYDSNLSVISGEFNFKVKDQENNIVQIENGKFSNLKLVQIP